MEQIVKEEPEDFDNWPPCDVLIEEASSDNFPVVKNENNSDKKGNDRSEHEDSSNNRVFFKEEICEQDEAKKEDSSIKRPCSMKGTTTGRQKDGSSRNVEEYYEMVEDQPDAKVEEQQENLVRMSSSSNESDSETVENASNELQFIAEGIAAAPVILHRSQQPKIKRRKDESIKILAKKYKASFGKPLDRKGLLKKINNMKARLKKKMDQKNTGNKPIKLLDWEKHLLKAMQGESNSSIVRIGGAMKVGVDCGINEGVTQQNGSGITIRRRVNERKTSDAYVPAVKLPPEKISTDNYETDETRGLGTDELKRLVLLQQYRTSILQMKYYEKKLEMMHNKDSTSRTVSDR